MLQSYDQTTKKWHMIRVQHVRMDDDEARERADAAAEVADPRYLLGGLDADADDVDDWPLAPQPATLATRPSRTPAFPLTSPDAGVATT